MQASSIDSIQAKIRRNLIGYSLAPGLTKDKRLEIMNKVQEALSKFEGELSGEF